MRQKKPSSRTTNRNRRKRKDGSLIKVLSVLFVMVALCVGAYWNVNGGTVSTTLPETKIASLTGGKASGKDMDYTEAAQELQQSMDTWLQSQGASTSILETKKRTEDRRATGGHIYWTMNKVRVVPAKEINRQMVEAELAKSNGKAILYSVQKTTIDNDDVMEYDVALFDMLDTEQLSMVVEKLYVTSPGAGTGVLDKVKALIIGAVRGTSGTADTTVKEDKKTGSKAKDTSKPGTVKARLAIVIDDFGQRKNVLPVFNSIPVPLTYAVMPNKVYTTECANSGFDAGRQIFVHVPMQPIKVASSEAVYISPDMSGNDIKATTKRMLDQVPHAIGANNHQGSYATTKPETMKAFLNVLKARHLIYLDSRTNSTSIGAQTASAMGVATGRNNLFIDNDDNVPAIKSRLRQAGQIALNNGSAIVIGHCRPNTAEAIREMIDTLHKEGIDIVFVSELMQ